MPKLDEVVTVERLRSMFTKLSTQLEAVRPSSPSPSPTFTASASPAASPVASPVCASLLEGMEGYGVVAEGDQLRALLDEVGDILNLL